MKQTAVEWLFEQYVNKSIITIEDIEKAKQMEKKQLFLASNTSAKEAYVAGQASMYCGCYDIDGCTNYEEWLYETFKSE
jgi:hypothetical protein